MHKLNTKINLDYRIRIKKYFIWITWNIGINLIEKLITRINFQGIINNIEYWKWGIIIS